MDISDVQSRDWSISIKSFGDLVQDSQDISQCIQIILTTDKGSDPLRPSFGSNIFRNIDEPVNQLIPLVKNEIIKQVGRWEPRAEVTSVTHKIEGEKVTFSVLYRDKRSNTSGETKITV